MKTESVMMSEESSLATGNRASKSTRPFKSYSVAIENLDGGYEIVDVTGTSDEDRLQSYVKNGCKIVEKFQQEF